MKAYLLTSKDCTPCEDYKKQLAVPLQTGEISELSFDEHPEQVTEMITKHKADIPGIVVLSDDGELLAKG